MLNQGTYAWVGDANDSADFGGGTVSVSVQNADSNDTIGLSGNPDGSDNYGAVWTDGEHVYHGWHTDGTPRETLGDIEDNGDGSVTITIADGVSVGMVSSIVNSLTYSNSDIDTQGTKDIDITVTDPHGASTTSTAHVEVAQGNTAPEANDDSGSGGSPLDLTGATDVGDGGDNWDKAVENTGNSDDVTVTAGDNWDGVYSGNGDDNIQIGDASDEGVAKVFLRDGDDTIEVGRGWDQIQGGAGDDTVTVGDDVQHGATINTGSGDDTVTEGGNAEDDATINTGDGADTISVGTDIKDTTINTGSGNDTITTGDDIEGGSTLNMGSGDDTIETQGSIHASSQIDMGEGDDTINITEGDSRAEYEVVRGG